MAGPRPAHPDAVVTGLDPNLTYLRLAAAADCVRAGARFIATNRDPVYPTERGLRPGAGSIAAALEAHDRRDAATRSASPAPHLLELAAEAVGRDAKDAIMIGDGIAHRPRRGPGRRGAVRADADRGDHRGRGRGAPDEERPTAIAEDAAGLAAALEAMSAR